MQTHIHFVCFTLKQLYHCNTCSLHIYYIVHTTLLTEKSACVVLQLILKTNFTNCVHLVSTSS